MCVCMYVRVCVCVCVYLDDILLFSGRGKVQGERRRCCQSLWKQQLQDGAFIIAIIQIIIGTVSLKLFIKIMFEISFGITQVIQDLCTLVSDDIEHLAGTNPYLIIFTNIKRVLNSFLPLHI